jgi:hypothetical protein
MSDGQGRGRAVVLTVAMRHEQAEDSCDGSPARAHDPSTLARDSHRVEAHRESRACEPVRVTAPPGNHPA